MSGALTSLALEKIFEFVENWRPKMPHLLARITAAMEFAFVDFESVRVNIFFFLNIFDIIKSLPINYVNYKQYMSNSGFQI